MKQLPRMQSYYYAPYFPQAVKNYGPLPINLNDQDAPLFGLKRPDLGSDVQVYRYHDGYYTMDELHQYGALPALPPQGN